MTMKLNWARFLAAAVLLLISGPALADKRVALVIGNSAYQNVPVLANAANDAAIMETTFRQAGFDVVEARHDLSALETRRALRDFADKASDADIAVIYYAGHGIEVEGVNYLIPVDAKLERDSDVFDEAFSINRILVAVQTARQLRLVILDACRDNPFSKTMQRTAGSREVARGLARIEPTELNTLIAYSAKAGSIAQDGNGRNSPFTMALARHLTTPGLDLRRAFGFVRDEVLKATSNRQEPFLYGSLGGEDVTLVPVPKPAALPSPAPDPLTEMRRDYELALQIGNKSAFTAFLAQHPTGYYASLARLQLEKIAAEEAHSDSIDKANQAEQDRAQLEAEAAQREAQAKAEAEARSAEQARLAAEKASQIAKEQAAEAERKRSEVASATARPPAETTPADSAAEKLAALYEAPSHPDLTKSVQAELRRVGCLAAPADGDWNSASQRSLAAFNRNAGTRFDVKAVNVEMLDAIKQKRSRVCPLVCEHGFRVNGDQCTKIVCTEGSFLNDDNECEIGRAHV